MGNKRKEIFLYPAITAIVCAGVFALGDWRRGTFGPIWWYFIAALVIYAVIVLGKYLIWRKKN